MVDKPQTKAWWAWLLRTLAPSKARGGVGNKNSKKGKLQWG